MLRRCRHRSAHDPEAVVDVLLDLDALPEWNAALRRVVERPDVLRPGASWVVEVQALGQSWRSRSTAEEVDRAGGRLTYVSRTDDGNPSWGRWSWHVTPRAGGGSDVVVTWELHPRTFWRRVLLARVRDLALRRREVPASLAALDEAVSRRAAPAPPGAREPGR